MSRSKHVRILGHITRPSLGEGRQTPDRQMFFVNKRPCALPQIVKSFNEAYKMFNVAQSPFILADLRIDASKLPGSGSVLIPVGLSNVICRRLRRQCIAGQADNSFA